MNNKFEIDFLTNKDNYYLTSNNKKKIKKTTDDFELSDVAFYRMEEVSFEDQSPRKEALENVLGTMKIEGINFIYLILGDGNEVNFYYGISRNYISGKEPELSILDIGEKILKPSIKGNFRGSRIKCVETEERQALINSIRNMKEYSMLEGVPGYTKEDEKFQGVDRLADVMMGDKFGFMIIATPANYDDIKEIEKNLYDVYSRIVPLAKKNIQSGSNASTSVSEGTSSGTSSSVAENYSKSKQESINITNGTSNTDTTQDGTNSSQGTSTNETSGDGCGDSSSKGTSKSGGKSHSKSIAKGTNHSEGKTTGGSETSGTTKTSGNNKGVSKQTTEGSGTSEATTLEYIDKKSQDWIKYLDEVIIPRLDYGMGKGIFITTSFLFSDSKPVLKKLENTAISLYSGETGNKVPLRAFSLKKADEIWKSLTNFQLAYGEMHNKNSEHEGVSRSALSQYMKEEKTFFLGNWITTNELAMIAGLPQKEVVGLALREEVEFGLNYHDDIKESNKILLGDLVQSGSILENSQVYLDKKNLDKHIFISGVTGSGKTTTCQNILYESDLPFLVIEPAKTEYRIMKQDNPDLLVFTLGNENIGTPFRLNPFEFFPHESITSRVDMIKASIEAAFDMEAAIPQLIESAIYACYEDYGWNISKNKNEKYDNPMTPFEDGVYAFPTMQDLINKIPEIVDAQGFDTRLKNDYVGSIKARLMGLLMGAKGMMLNTKRSVDFRDLLEKKVVLELEEIRNGSEKSLIMGFVLTNLMQAIKAKFLETGKAYSHITLVEEAHRLLSKFVAGDSPNKKQGVETFTDMLAEIRKYGECLVIVDQIPNKLTPEILKNTNTKIVHKLFASDDKDAIGNTIVLDKDQKEFLSNLETGRAIVFSQGYSKALQVQIRKRTDTDAEIKIKDVDLKDSVYDYYAKNYKKGIIMNTQFLNEEPTIEQIEQILDISKDSALCEAVYLYGELYKAFPSEDMLEKISAAIKDEGFARVFSEIKKTKKSGNMIIRKDEQVELLRKYLNEFELVYIIRLLISLHYGLKEGRNHIGWAKAKRNLSLKSNEKKLLRYIEKYISDVELEPAEALVFENLL